MSASTRFRDSVEAAIARADLIASTIPLPEKPRARFQRELSLRLTKDLLRAMAGALDDGMAHDDTRFALAGAIGPALSSVAMSASNGEPARAHVLLGAMVGILEKRALAGLDPGAVFVAEDVAGARH